MFHIFLPVDDSLIDIFISQSEEFRNRNDQFLHDAPISFPQRTVPKNPWLRLQKSFPMVS